MLLLKFSSERERERAKDLQRRRKSRRFGIIEVGARGIGNIKARGRNVGFVAIAGAE